QTTGGRVDTALRHVDVLRRRAHLPGVEGQRERDVAGDAREVVGRVDDDLVHARLLGVHLRLLRIRLEPVAVRRTAGEVDEAHFGTEGQLLRDVVGGVVRNQCDDVRIEAAL